MNWNPTAGDYYKTATHRKTRSDTARQRRQYGALSGASVDASMDPSPSAGAFSDTGGRAFIRRSKRNKKQKTPETIDIVSSESEDDPSVTSKEEEPRIVKVSLLFRTLIRAASSLYSQCQVVVFLTRISRPLELFGCRRTSVASQTTSGGPKQNPEARRRETFC